HFFIPGNLQERHQPVSCLMLFDLRDLTTNIELVTLCCLFKCLRRIYSNLLNRLTILVHRVNRDVVTNQPHLCIDYCLFIREIWCPSILNPSTVIEVLKDRCPLPKPIKRTNTDQCFEDVLLSTSSTTCLF